jgi:hypothetical protein
VKSSIDSKDVLKTGDINNTNYNENKQNNVTIGVPTICSSAAIAGRRGPVSRLWHQPEPAIPSSTSI